LLYDLTVPLRTDMPTWDGEPGPELKPLMTLAEHGVEVSALSLGVHCGTHVDAPRHFLAGGAGAEAYPLAAMLGPCLVVAIPGRGHVSIRPSCRPGSSD
jgi:arylformamidase